MSFLPLQLPIKVGHQNTHTKVSTEHNKECLINISKYKFSLVISGLTTILKNVNNMVSVGPCAPLLSKVKGQQVREPAALFSPAGAPFFTSL